MKEFEQKLQEYADAHNLPDNIKDYIAEAFRAGGAMSYVITLEAVKAKNADDVRKIGDYFKNWSQS